MHLSQHAFSFSFSLPPTILWTFVTRPFYSIFCVSFTSRPTSVHTNRHINHVIITGVMLLYMCSERVRVTPSTRSDSDSDFPCAFWVALRRLASTRSEWSRDVFPVRVLAALTIRRAILPRFHAGAAYCTSTTDTANLDYSQADSVLCNFCTVFLIKAMRRLGKHTTRWVRPHVELDAMCSWWYLIERVFSMMGI